MDTYTADSSHLKTQHLTLESEMSDSSSNWVGPASVAVSTILFLLLSINWIIYGLNHLFLAPVVIYSCVEGSILCINFVCAFLYCISLRHPDSNLNPKFISTRHVLCGIIGVCASLMLFTNLASIIVFAALSSDTYRAKNGPSEYDHMNMPTWAHNSTTTAPDDHCNSKAVPYIIIGFFSLLTCFIQLAIAFSVIFKKADEERRLKSMQKALQEETPSYALQHLLVEL